MAEGVISLHPTAKHGTDFMEVLGECSFFTACYHLPDLGKTVGRSISTLLQQNIPRF